MTDTKRTAIDAVARIDGWLTPTEASILYDEAAKSTGPIVEIGAWRGRSTAALALGSMSGHHQPVYAIDAFREVQHTVTGKKFPASSPVILRANLDNAGVNGLVNIVAKSTDEAVAEVPDCSVLFVDGSHDYESVKRDLSLFLPKVRHRGMVIIHDCHTDEPGVVKAVDELLTSDPATWRCRWRADSCLVYQRCGGVRYSVMVGFPGGSLCYGTHRGLATASMGAHDVYEDQSGIGWDDMNRLWCHALNQAHHGRISHFGMLHSDVMPSPGWVDLLADELTERGADFISAVCALKTDEGITTCGIGDPDNPWSPFRRFTMRELVKMPETFGIEDTSHPNKYLLHNTGCWLADLRNPIWRTVDGHGCLVADLSFPIRGRLTDNGEFVHERESEDWHFSRMMARLGMKTLATRRVTTVHYGTAGYRNDHAWGKLEHDEATKVKWGAEPCQT